MNPRTIFNTIYRKTFRIKTFPLSKTTNMKTTSKLKSALWRKTRAFGWQRKKTKFKSMRLWIITKSTSTMTSSLFVKKCFYF